MIYLHKIRYALIGFLVMMIESSGGRMYLAPRNAAVRLGASRVEMVCSSDEGVLTLEWSYIQFGNSSEVHIGTGSIVDDEQKEFYAVETMASQKQSTLIIPLAILDRAGTYYCTQGATKSSAQLTMYFADPVCRMTPKVPKELNISQEVQMSCSFEYMPTAPFVSVEMVWSEQGRSSNFHPVFTRKNMSYYWTTAESKLTTTLGPSSETHQCYITFTIVDPPPGAATNRPDCNFTNLVFVSSITVAPDSLTSTTSKADEAGESGEDTEDNSKANIVKGQGGFVLLQLFLAFIAAYVGIG